MLLAPLIRSLKGEITVEKVHIISFEIMYKKRGVTLIVKNFLLYLI